VHEQKNLKPAYNIIHINITDTFLFSIICTINALASNQHLNRFVHFLFLMECAGSLHQCFMHHLLETTAVATLGNSSGNSWTISIFYSTKPNHPIFYIHHVEPSLIHRKQQLRRWWAFIPFPPPHCCLCYVRVWTADTCFKGWQT